MERKELENYKITKYIVSKKGETKCRHCNRWSDSNIALESENPGSDPLYICYPCLRSLLEDKPREEAKKDIYEDSLGDIFTNKGW